MAELLVVMVLLSVVGAVTTAGVVRGLQVQTTAEGVASTLDESRIALQRMRDVIRGGTAICPGSTGARLEVWTDRPDAGAGGVFEDEELVVFEVDGDTSKLTRQDPGGGSDVLISEAIVNTDVFQYPDDPVAQTAFSCTVGELVPGTAPITSQVMVTLDVNNPTDGPVLTADTVIRLRNAGLRGLGAVASGEAPIASIIGPGSCVVGEDCNFDGSDSEDPQSDELDYAWYVGDDDQLRSEEVTFTERFDTAGEFVVHLVVTDADGNVDDASESVLVVRFGQNRPPVAAFTYDCRESICDVDATGSLDGNNSEPGVGASSDPDGDELNYEWVATTSSGTTPELYESTPDGSAGQFNFVGADEATIVLNVDDRRGGTDSSSVTVSTAAIRLAGLSAEGEPASSGSFTATVDVSLTTSTDVASPNQQVTFRVTVEQGGVSQTMLPCGPTDSNGRCSVSLSAQQNATVTFSVASVVPVGGGSGTYDEDLNQVEDSVSVTAGITDIADEI